MIEHRYNPWHVEQVELAVVERLASSHVAHPDAVTISTSSVTPHRENDKGRNWTRLRFARRVADVAPGSAVMMGTPVGNYLAKVVAWDFEANDDDPIVVLDLSPLTPESVQAAIQRSSVSAA